MAWPHHKTILSAGSIFWCCSNCEEDGLIIYPCNLSSGEAPKYSIITTNVGAAVKHFSQQVLEMLSVHLKCTPLMLKFIAINQKLLGLKKKENATADKALTEVHLNCASSILHIPVVQRWRDLQAHQGEINQLNRPCFIRCDQPKKYPKPSDRSHFSILPSSSCSATPLGHLWGEHFNAAGLPNVHLLQWIQCLKVVWQIVCSLQDPKRTILFLLVHKLLLHSSWGQSMSSLANVPTMGLCVGFMLTAWLHVHVL